MKKIRHINSFDMLNTFGNVAVSVWMQGCPHRCKGCFNPETWKETDNFLKTEDLTELKKALTKDGITKDVSYLGGDPFAPSNREAFITLLQYVNHFFKDTKQYVWTGYDFEKIRHLPHLKYLDVVVDGRFIQELKVEGKKYGSSNQRVWMMENGIWKITDKY